MEYALDRFARELREAIAATGAVPTEQIELVTPKPNIPADLAFPAFRAAKEQGIAPPQLVQKLAHAIQLPPDSLIESVAAAGPFLNATLNNTALSDVVLAEISRLGERYGSDDIGAGKTIVIDYSSPNIAKTMHVGHIRSTIIGQALYNIFSFLGYRTIGDNHLGDWGTQFGMNIAAILRWGKPDAEGEEAIAQIDKLYMEYNRLAKDDPSLQDEARAWSLKLEQNDPVARELWQWLVDLTMQANQPNYDRLGVKFDHAYGESFYAPWTEEMIELAIAKGAAYRDEQGAVVVAELEKNMPSFLLQRSDTGTLYHTRDLAGIRYRIEQFNPTHIIYAVDARQELNFRQLFALARAVGLADNLVLEHVKFGTIFDQHGQPLSTRKGNMIYLADLLDDAHQRARAVVEQGDTSMSDAEKEQVAEIVGIGSVIYNDLFQDPRRNITLDWERMLSREGNSATYIQYMYARCRSILRIADATNDPEIDMEKESDLILEPGSALLQLGSNRVLLQHPSEIDLIKQLAKLPGAVREAALRYAPFVIAEWCYETARALSGFYRDCPVLKAPSPELRSARLELVAATAQVLKNGMALLNIRVPERM